MEFQFLIGKLKSDDSSTIISPGPGFQFLIGKLKSLTTGIYSKSQGCFNSL